MTKLVDNDQCMAYLRGTCRARQPTNDVKIPPSNFWLGCAVLIVALFSAGCSGNTNIDSWCRYDVVDTPWQIFPWIVGGAIASLLSVFFLWRHYRGFKNWDLAESVDGPSIIRLKLYLGITLGIIVLLVVVPLLFASTCTVLSRIISSVFWSIGVVIGGILCYRAYRRFGLNKK